MFSGFLRVGVATVPPAADEAAAARLETIYDEIPFLTGQILTAALKMRE